MAKSYFDERNKVYSQIGTLSATETKIWFEVSDYSIKMQFVIIAIDEKKYQKFSKDFDKIFGKMNQDIDRLFKELNKELDKFFKKIKPMLDDTFEMFEELLGDIFGSEKKKNNNYLFLWWALCDACFFL